MYTQGGLHKLVIIHSEADEPDVHKLVKCLSPLLAKQELVIWHRDKEVVGTDRLFALRKALRETDMVAVWISTDLWSGTEEFEFVQENKALIPAGVPIVPIVARHTASWEIMPLFSGATKNVLPVDLLPMPTQAKDLQDAWLSNVAQGIAEKMGLDSSPLAGSGSFWQKLGPNRKTWMVAAFAILLIVLVFGSIQLFSTTKDAHQGKVSNEGHVTTKDVKSVVECSFSPNFVRDSLFILITRFEDDENEHETKCYGTGIEWRINDLASRSHLPIRTCYRDDFSPNQEYAADIYRKETNADLVIWGKLRNAGPDCKADGFCLRFNPSDTLIRYAGGTIEKDPESVFQENKSSVDLQTGSVSMGSETFDNWLVGMYNLKIGAKKPEFYLIDDNWPTEKKAEAFRIRGEAWLALGVYEKAMADFKETASLVPNNGENYFKLGASANSLKNYAAAISYFDSSLLFDPGKIRTYFFRGNSKMQLKQYNAAFLDYEKAIKLDPRNASSYISRANNYVKQRDFDEAIRDYDMAIEIDPKNAAAYIYRAQTKSKARRFSEALDDSNKAVQLFPKNSTSYAIRAEVRRKQKNFKEAINDCDSSISIGGKRNDVLIIRGLAKAGLKRYTEALQDIDQSIQLYKHNSEAYWARGRINAFAGFPKEAIQDFDKCLSLDSVDALSYSVRGGLKADIGQHAEAIVDCNKSIELEPNNPSYYHNRAYCYRKQWKLWLAIEDLFREFKLAPERFWYLVFVPFGLYYGVKWIRKRWRKRRKE